MPGDKITASADKYTAVWVSHSSINDYIKCPRLYYLRNVYKDPKTGHKITRMQPALALGQTVHEVIESLSILPSEQRLEIPLTKKFEVAWKKVTGEKGGFTNGIDEKKYWERGVEMLKRIENNPKPILEKAIKIKQELPHYWLSEDDNIILCGKIDWLQYNEETDSVHILDFKTGKYDEDADSLQLPIYHLLVANTQKRVVNGASYWYLNRDDQPKEVQLPQLDIAHNRVLEIAKKIALARKLDHFKCNNKEGCNGCIPLEKIIKGEGKLVGISEYKQDIYIL